MAIFTRKKKDPAADAYRNMAREAAAKKQYDFIGKTGKMDDEIENTGRYKRAEDKFKDVITKPLKEGAESLQEGYGGSAWLPMEDDHSLHVLHSDEPANRALRNEWVHDLIKKNHTAYVSKEPGRMLEEAPLHHSDKHKIATELFHHDPDTLRTRIKDPDSMTQEQFHSSKLPIDRVLEEMTRHRPNPENRQRIVDGINSFKKENPAVHKYLKDKYRFAVDNEPVGPFKKYEPHEKIMSHDEVMAHKDKYNFVNGRVLAKHEEGVNVYDQKKYQLHPDGSLTRVSNLIPHIHAMDYNMPFDSDEAQKSAEFHHENLKDMHGEHISASGVIPEVARYTRDSRPLNKYLATGTIRNEWGDKLDDDEEGAKGAKANLDQWQKNMSDSMVSAPPYAHKFQVWTGLSKSNDVGAYSAKKTDKNEKLIGHFPAFTSTSMYPKEAAGFAKPKPAENFPLQDVRDLVRVDIPKAYHRGLYVEKHTMTKGEREYILDNDTTMEFHPQPKYYAENHRLHRVWKARPILSDEDQEYINERSRRAREN